MNQQVFPIRFALFVFFFCFFLRWIEWRRERVSVLFARQFVKTTCLLEGLKETELIFPFLCCLIKTSVNTHNHMFRFCRPVNLTFVLIAVVRMFSLKHFSSSCCAFCAQSRARPKMITNKKSGWSIKRDQTFLHKRF